MDVSKLVRLARLRHEISKARLEKDRRVAEFNDANKDLFELIRALSEAIDELEAEVRDEAVAEFKETGDRDAVPGVKFRMVKVAKYDPDAALRWAVERGETGVLKLDKRTFERVVKGANPDLLKASGLDFVDVDIEPQATLASNLKAELAKVGVVGEEEQL